MSPTEFCYWLQGFFELTAAGDPEHVAPLTQAQAVCITKHTDLDIHGLHPRPYTPPRDKPVFRC